MRYSYVYVNTTRIQVQNRQLILGCPNNRFQISEYSHGTSYKTGIQFNMVVITMFLTIILTISMFKHRRNKLILLVKNIEGFNYRGYSNSTSYNR